MNAPIITDQEYRSRLREIFRNFDLQDLQDAEFRRLIRFAHAEGRLAAILQEEGILGPLAASQNHALDRQSLSSDQSIRWPWRHQRCLQNAHILRLQKYWFGSISWVRSYFNGG